MNVVLEKNLISTKTSLNRSTEAPLLLALSPTFPLHWDMHRAPSTLDFWSLVTRPDR